MALADDPKAFIHRMFSMEVQEGRGKHCSIYPEGERVVGLPLEDDELVYGAYKGKYFFTPMSLIIREDASTRRIRWTDIARCSTQHGDGSSSSVLTLRDGSQHRVRVSELVQGWAGRTSQLYHGMIRRWGCQACFGESPMTMEAFFGIADNDHAFAPNLEPHPTLEELRSDLEALTLAPTVRRVWLQPSDSNEFELAVSCMYVVTSGPACKATEAFAARYRAAGVGPWRERTSGMLGELSEADYVYELRWD